MLKLDTSYDYMRWKGSLGYWIQCKFSLSSPLLFMNLLDLLFFAMSFLVDSQNLFLSQRLENFSSVLSTEFYISCFWLSVPFTVFALFFFCILIANCFLCTLFSTTSFFWYGKSSSFINEVLLMSHQFFPPRITSVTYYDYRFLSNDLTFLHWL